MYKLFRRISYLLHRRRHDRDLADEMAAHRAELPTGRSASFGSGLRLREQSRDVWGFLWLDQLWQDLAYGARQLRRSPGFTLTAIVVLALGVGLNLSVFHVIKAIFYSRIALADSARLERVIRQSPERSFYAFPPALAEFLRQNATQFSYLVTERQGTVALNLGDPEQRPARTQFVSGNYFNALSVAPLRGRLLDPRDDDPAAAPAGVLGYGYWQRVYGGDPKVINRVVLVNQKPVRIVGVTQADFSGLSPNGADLWLPARQRAYVIGQTEPLEANLRADTALAGVVKPGVSPAGASAELQALTGQWRAREVHALEDDEVIRARPLGEDDRNLGPYFTLIPMTMLVLFCACANLGNMLLARGIARAREIETRIAVGAGRWRVVRQLMTENLLLSALGAMAGLLVARAGVQVFLTMFRINTDNIRIETDWRMVLAAAALALLSTLLFGLAPALNAARRSRRSTLSRRILLSVQVAASCVLVVLSGLMVRAAERLTESGSRLDFQEIVLVDPQLGQANLAPAAARRAMDDIAEKIRQLPGVRGVTLAAGMPVFGVRVENAPGLPTTFWQSVDPSYFALMGVSITRGRNFGPNEPPGNIIVSESAARFRWPGQDPLKRIWEPQGVGRTVVGIAADTDATAFRNPSAIEAYGPLPDSIAANATLIVRTIGDPDPRLAGLRAAATLPGLTPSVALLQSYVDGMVEHAGSATKMIGALGSVASFLAAIGIFGLVAYAVTERTREIGLRVALGARARDILRALFASYTVPLAVGMVLGIALAAVLEQTFRSMIILGLIAFDPQGYLLGLAAFAAVVLAALIIPVRRALRIDPASALRWE